MPIYHRHKDESTLTIPLHACCPNCEHITKECLKEGKQWQEKFTKGARRRRSASLDNTTPYTSTSATPTGFTAIAAVSGSGTAVIPITCTNKFVLTVDKVDMQCKSQEITLTDEGLTCMWTLSNPSAPTYHCPTASPYNISAPPLCLS
ncbi:hypothetical protein BDQ17DRAFT_1431518 [Cyathus striatus]|nr:hypothetical protein BDQ17DRAFT_1431518 [Cyathus striatus]